MKSKIAGAVLAFAFAFPALAQQAPPPADTTPRSVTLTMAEWNVVWAALGKEPWNTVAPIMGKIHAQVSAPPPAPSEPPKP